MKILLLLACVVLLGVSRVNSINSDALVICNRIGNTLTIEAQYIDTARNFDFLLGGWGNLEKLCISTYEDDKHRLQLSIDITDPTDTYQVDPIQSKADCNYYINDTTNAAVLEVYVMKSNSIIGSFNKRFTAACSLNSPDQLLNSTHVQVGDMPSIPSEVPINAAVPAVACQVEDPANPGVGLVGTLSLGMAIDLVCTVTVTDGIVQGLQISNMVFASNSELRGIVINMLDENGCLSDNKVSALFYSPEMNNNQLSFVNGTAYNSSEDYDFSGETILTYKFGTFYANGILNLGSKLPTDKLFIGFHYKMACANVHSEKCTDQETYCRKNGLNLRAKRSAETIEGDMITEGDMAVLIKLDVPANTAPLLDTTNQITQEQSETPEIAECDRPTFLWMLAAIFGVLLLLVVVICVFLALRLRRERGRKERAFESNGH